MEKENKGKREARKEAREASNQAINYDTTDDGSIINSTPIDEGLNDDAYRRLLYIAVVEDQYKEY